MRRRHVSVNEYTYVGWKSAFESTSDMVAAAELHPCAFFGEQVRLGFDRDVAGFQDRAAGAWASPFIAVPEEVLRFAAQAAETRARALVPCRTLKVCLAEAQRA